MSLDKILASCKDFDTLKDFAKAQNKIIADLNSKLSELEQKNTNLNIMLKETPNSIENVIEDLADDPNNEEHIAKVQLKRLKRISEDRELTLEESKRVEIFAKIVWACKNKKKDANDPAKNSETADLLSIVSELNATS